ncbi:MAG: DNA-binding response OmpR family regulator [Nitriliruptoraceae bacterium]
MEFARILLVEDDDSVAAPLERALTRECYELRRVTTGADALLAHAEGGIDLILLDLGLPDIDGLEVCRRIREVDENVVVLILTARGDELDRVVGLDVGADDYLAKPFGLAELLARIRAALRRAKRSTPAVADRANGAVEIGGHEGLVLRLAARRVFVGDQELSLSTKEFDLLATLHAEAGTVRTRESLMDDVWDENWFGSTKTLDVTLGRLRQKLENTSAPVRIVSVRGVGFRLELGEPGA